MLLLESLDTSWRKVLKKEFSKVYFLELQNFLLNEEKNYTLFPHPHNVFNAFNLTPFENVKVVILGQDPYHGEGQSHGLAFSVQQGTKIPPSLQNIFKELVEDTGGETPQSGDLTHWAQQGVLLLNTLLTVRSAEPLSHQNRGWEQFTDAVIKTLSTQCEHLVFILWGAPAAKKTALIDGTKHLILKAPHPSPLSSYRGFFGSKPFTQTNAYLREWGIKEIEWSL
ncbi:MAG: uracil-DNA glycosylase [Campylobacterales bacterium]|nr:uracil-DNA glycosylase [Campylobacterales bacterium]